MQTIKIGFDAKRAFLNNTGLGNYSRTLLKNLLHYHSNIEAHLFCTKKIKNLENKWLNTQNVSLHYPANIIQNLKLQAIWRSALIPYDKNYKQLQIYHGLSNEIPFTTLAKKTKTVVSIHDLIFLRYPKQYQLINKYIYTQKSKYSCQNSDLIIAISNQTKSDLINFLQVPEQKINVVYQSCQEQFYNGIQYPKPLNLPNNYLLSVGSLTERKNTIAILKALKILQPKLKIPLVIIGNGKAYKKLIINYIQANNLSSSVMLINDVSNNDLPAYYQHAAAFVYPSLFEGFGIPIIEAQFSKTPVITSVGSCFLEVGGAHAMYIEPTNIEMLANAIETVLTNTNLANLIKEQGFINAQQFLPIPTANSLLNTYYKLL